MRVGLLAILAGATALAGCATTAQRERELRAEFVEVARNCGLPRHSVEVDRGAREIRIAFLHGSNIALHTERNGSLGCARHWASERGYRLLTGLDEDSNT